MVLKTELSTDVHYKHVYARGKLYRTDKGQRYYDRDDVCTLCGCVRNSIEFTRAGQHFDLIVMYTRSGAQYSKDHEPLCWGAKQQN